MDARTSTEPRGARLNGNVVAPGRYALPHLIDVATLAEHLGLTERTIRRKVAQGEIPYYKLGNSIRFDPVEIGACLEASRVANHPAGADNGMRP
ncbi:MAG: helix-turn-helix domain-containing protein [Acidimicrobiales bacterium]